MPLKKVEATEEAWGAGDMVGGSVFPTVCLSFYQCLSLSFPAPFPHPFSFIRCQQATRYRENPGRRAGSGVRAQGQQSPGQAVTECSVLERQDWSGRRWLTTKPDTLAGSPLATALALHPPAPLNLPRRARGGDRGTEWEACGTARCGRNRKPLLISLGSSALSPTSKRLLDA